MSKQETVDHRMTVKEFNEQLKLQAPKLYERMNSVKVSDTSPPVSKEDFLQTIKTEAPALYQRLEKADFKFNLDTETNQTVSHVLLNADNLTGSAGISSSEFMERLKVEAPDLFQSLSGEDKPLTMENIVSAFDPNAFIQAIKKKAPKLYALLESVNFKLQVDQKHIDKWNAVLKDSEHIKSK